MAYAIEGTDEFVAWFDGLSSHEKASVAAKIDVLEEFGPALGRPSVDTVRGSRYRNLKELRIQHVGRPYRVFFIFDPRRAAILLIGGRKSGKGFYKRMVPRADNVYEQYLKEEGLD